MSKRGNPGKHIGFRAAAAEAARDSGESYENGTKMIAAGARKASASAKAKNPALKKVKGK